MGRAHVLIIIANVLIVMQKNKKNKYKQNKSGNTIVRKEIRQRKETVIDKIPIHI